MADSEKLWWKKIAGIDEDHLPDHSLEDLDELVEQEFASGYPNARFLGYRTLDNVEYYIQEEKFKLNVHLLGAPDEGKSKFFELLIRDTLTLGLKLQEEGRNPIGACLLDPSDNGDTMYKVLRWCMATGFEKVCIIDPHDWQVAIPAIQPKHHVMDTVRVLFGNKDLGDTPRVKRFLPALFSVFEKSRTPLSEFRYFMIQPDINYRMRREEIFSRIKGSDGKEDKEDFDRLIVSNAYRTERVFEQFFESTVNRITPFAQDYFRFLLGPVTGIDFKTLIREGWLILCNLDYHGVKSPKFGEDQQQLLGMLVINEIAEALRTMTATGSKTKGWGTPYYVFVDEVGRFANRTLSNILFHQRKLGLRLFMAHQSFVQFEDRTVEKSVMAAGRIKVLFQTADPEDRMKMIQQMYGGELSDRTVSYALAQLEKQHAVIKVGKANPLTVRIKSVASYDDYSRKDIQAFKEKIYNRDPWYHSPDEIERQISARFEQPEQSNNVRPKEHNLKSAEPSAADDRVSAREAEPLRQGGEPPQSSFAKRLAKTDLESRLIPERDADTRVTRKKRTGTPKRAKRDKPTRDMGTEDDKVSP